MSQIQIQQDAGSIIGVNIGNESSFHFQCVVDLRPVFQGQIDGPGAKVRAADAYLADSGKLFAGSVGNLAGMHFIGKISNAFLLANVKIPLVYLPHPQ